MSCLFQPSGRARKKKEESISSSFLSTGRERELWESLVRIIYVDRLGRRGKKGNTFSRFHSIEGKSSGRGVLRRVSCHGPFWRGRENRQEPAIVSTGGRGLLGGERGGVDTHSPDECRDLREKREFRSKGGGGRCVPDGGYQDREEKPFDDLISCRRKDRCGLLAYRVN